MATNSTQKPVTSMEDTQNVNSSVQGSSAQIIASVSVSWEKPKVLPNAGLRAAVSAMYSKAMSSRTEAEAKQDASIMPRIRHVTECGTPILYYRQISTPEQRTALSRPYRYMIPIASGHNNPDVKVLILSPLAGLGHFLSTYELSCNREKMLRDETRFHDLICEIEFLRRSLHLLLLRAKPDSCEQTRPQGVNTARDVKVDVTAAEKEEQKVHDETFSNLAMSDYPMTAGHLEIQAVKEATKEVSNAVLSQKNAFKALPLQLSQEHQTIIYNGLEAVSRAISRFPGCLTSLCVKRKTELDTIRNKAKMLRAAEERMATAEAKEMELEAKIGTFERDKNVADEEMKEATKLLRAVQARETLVAGRERRVVGLEEEQLLNDLNLGANAAMEDAAEAAAAEARVRKRAAGQMVGPIAAAEKQKYPVDLEKISRSHPAAGGHVVVPGTHTATAATEQELRRREDTLGFRETNLRHRETAIFTREQLLERMKMAQLQLMLNWNAQVDTSYAGLEVQGEDLQVKFHELIALKGRVEETQAKARALIWEAKGMIEKGGKGHERG